MQEDVSIFSPIKKDFNGVFNYGVFDIETNQTCGHIDATNFLGGDIYVNGQHFLFDKADEMVSFMMNLKYKGYTWFAHNARFDLAGLFGNIISTCNFKNGDIVIFAGSKLITLKKCVSTKKNGINKKTGKQKITKEYITFADSFNLLPVSIRELGKNMNYPKGEVDYTTITWNTECIEYCKRDCEILDKSLNMFFKTMINEYNVKPRLTTASSAMAVFKHCFYKMGEIVFNKSLDETCRNAYYGGRTEVHSERLENGYCFDVNSLYPSVMKGGNVYPSPEYMIKEPNPTNKKLLDLLKTHEGAAFIKVYCPDMQVPLLPYRNKDKLIFPVGIFSGWYCFPEIRKAIELGYEIIEVFDIIHTIPIDSPFDFFITEMYNKRLECKKNNDALEYFYKILMNSLYGKFAQRNEIREIGYEADEGKCFDPELEFKQFSNDSDYGYWCKKDQTANEQRADHDIVIWAAYVTCHARLKLYSYMEKTDFNFAYCDTDSLYTPIELPTSKALGEMKLEYIVKDCIFIRPKHYSYVVNEEKHMKIKGIRNESIKDVKDTEQTYLRMTTPLEEIKQKLINPDTKEKFKAGEFRKISKKICLTDDKRKHLPDGTTQPISVYIN
jgi:hypothetical protein